MPPILSNQEIQFVFESPLQAATERSKADAFNAVPSPALLQSAIESKATLKRTNTRLLDLSVDRGALVQARGPIYDIYAGP